MPGRSYQPATPYKYGFNGKENDREVVGTGSGTQDYGMRIYNPSLGKFLSVDPLQKDFAWNSSYAFAENDVIRAVDLDGKEKRIIVKVRDDAGKIVAMKITTNIANGNVVNQFINQRNPDGTNQQIQNSDGSTYNNEGVVVLDYDSRGIVTVTFKSEKEMDKFETDVKNGDYQTSDTEVNFVRTTPLNKKNGFKETEYKNMTRSGDKSLKISSTYNSNLVTYEKDGGILKEAIYIDKSSTTITTPTPAVNDVLENIVQPE